MPCQAGEWPIGRGRSCSLIRRSALTCSLSAVVSFETRLRGSRLLLGRENECQVLEALLMQIERGMPEQSVSTENRASERLGLLNYAVDSASDFTVLRTAGSERRWSLPMQACRSSFVERQAH